MKTASRRIHWIATSVALAAVSLAGSSARPAAAEADPLLDLPFSTPGCSYYCRACGEGMHDIVVAVNSNAASYHLENCNEGSCPLHGCAVDNLPVTAMSELWFAARDGDDARLRELLREHRRVAYFNVARQAVQVRGCDGGVLASIPLSETQAAMLTE